MRAQSRVSKRVFRSHRVLVAENQTEVLFLRLAVKIQILASEGIGG